MWQVSWTDQALRDAARLDARTRARVEAAIDRLARTGYGDIKRLRDSGRVWRLRVGDWRVRFVFNHETHTIEVLRVLPRGRAYRE